MKDILEWVDAHNESRGFPLPILQVNAINPRTISISREDSSGGSMWIPLHISTPQLPQSSAQLVWFPRNKTRLRYTTDTRRPNLILLNSNSKEDTSFYRTVYDAGMTEKIVEQLLADHTLISENSRRSLLQDYFFLANKPNPLTSIESALELTRYLGKESSTFVWQPLEKVWLYDFVLNFWYNDKDAFEVVRAYLQPRMENLIKFSGGINASRQSSLLKFYASFEIPAFVNYAVELLKDWETNELESTRFYEEIGCGHNSDFFCAAVRADDDPMKENSITNFILKKYQETALVDWKEHLLFDLACTNNKTFMSSLLNDSLEFPVKLATEETSLVFLLQALNSRHPDLRDQWLVSIKENLLRGKVSPQGFANYLVSIPYFLYWKQPEELAAFADRVSQMDIF